MQSLARFAIGTTQPGVDGSFVAWALMAALERAGLRVQHFAARACFSPRDGAAGITGQATRHLDSWLMEPSDLRSLLVWGSGSSDLALIEGRFPSALSQGELAGGDLQTLCDWLKLPRVAILRCDQLVDCQLPECPPGVDGILIDGSPSCLERCRLQTSLEALWGVPVLGFAAASDDLRAQVAAVPMGTTASKELAASLSEQVFTQATLDRLITLARRDGGMTRTTTLSRAERADHPLRVAIAFDDAFHCYFPDTLDQLELQRAELVDFSPLRDDRLPGNIDLVYFGCGRPELFAQQLTKNCCLIAALRSYVAGGGRLYAECGGLAYLAKSIEMPGGRRISMSGVLPIDAQIQSVMQPQLAVELTLATDTWLGPTGSAVRGYRSGRWQFTSPAPCVTELSADDPCPCDVVQYHNAIGSRVHLNFAAQPPLMARLFKPHLIDRAMLAR